MRVIEDRIEMTNPAFTLTRYFAQAGEEHEVTVKFFDVFTQRDVTKRFYFTKVGNAMQGMLDLQAIIASAR